MKKRILATILALCLCLSSKSAAYTEQEGPFIQGNAPMGEAAFGAITRDSTVPTPQEAYQAMTALQSQDAYKEGTTWTNEEPYSDTKGCYYWNGGNLGGSRIAAVGCVAFAFILSDAAFGSLPARMYAAGSFAYTDIYFTGTEEQWNKIQKLGDTSQTVLKATIHYNYVPPAPGPGPDDGDDSAGDNSGGTGSGSDNSTGDNSGGTGSGSDNSTGDNSGGTGSGSYNSTGGNTGGTGSGSGNNPGGSTGNGNRPGISGGTQGGSQTGSGTYRILKGTEGLWKVNADGSVTISADGELADFDHLEIDGKSVDPSNYTLKSGSTIVTLKAEFLKTLGQGNHTVTFVYKVGQVSMTQPYGKDGVPSGMAAPKTGEERIPLARAALLLLPAAWIAIIYRKGKKESAGRQA